MILENHVMKRIKARYAAELAAMLEYTYLAEHTKMPESDIFLKEAERRLFICDYLNRLLISAHADLSNYNVMYVDAVRAIDHARKKIRK